MEPLRKEKREREREGRNRCVCMCASELKGHSIESSSGLGFCRKL